MSSPSRADAFTRTFSTVESAFTRQTKRSVSRALSAVAGIITTPGISPRSTVTLTKVPGRNAPDAFGNSTRSMMVEVDASTVFDEKTTVPFAVIAASPP